jgi:hypothetical protein
MAVIITVTIIIILWLSVTILFKGICSLLIWNPTVLFDLRLFESPRVHATQVLFVAVDRELSRRPCV